MRIGLVCPYSVDVPGGVQNHVLDLAAVLRSRGHQVGVLVPGEGAGLPAYVTTTGRAVPMPYNGSVARVAFGPLVAARVRRWLEGGAFDVVHIHEPATPSVSVLALWAARAPVVATYHTAQERTRTLETSAATFLRPALTKIRAHVAVSDAAAATMRRYIAAEPAHVPNGVDLERYAVPRPASPGPRVAFVGRLDEPRKGFSVLLAALPQVLAEHPEARVVVVGHGSLPTLPPAAAGRVDHLGPVDDRTKARVLAGASVFVAPNTHGESFGIVLVEAMAAGAPVVAADLPAFRRVLDDGRCGTLVPVGDPAALAASVSSLLADPLRRRLLTDRGRRAARRYSWPVVAPRIEAVYDAVCADAAAAG